MQDFEAIITDFENQLAKADDVLYDSVDIFQIVSNSLSVLKILNSNLPIELYVQVHSECLTYFSAFQKCISDKNKFSQEQLQKAFDFAFQNEILIPRLYTALLISSATEDINQINKALGSLISVFHPLRGIALRFTAVTLFSRKPNLISNFAQINFDEILLLVPQSLKLYPDSVKQVSEWLTPNISVALFFKDSRDLLIQHFFAASKSVNQPDISTAILTTIEQNIEPQTLVQNFNNFQNSINYIGHPEKTSELVENIVRHSPNSALGFNFIKIINNRNDFSLLVTQLALDSNDYETVKNCAALWPYDDVFKLIFSKCGHNKFANIVPNIPKSTPITEVFLETANDDVLPTAFRKVLENEMSKRSSTLNDDITKFVSTYELSESFLRTVFDEPYIPYGETMLKSIVNQCVRNKMDYKFALNLVKASANVPDKTKVSILCEILPPNEINEILQYVTDLEGFQSLLPHLSAFDVTSEIIIELNKKFLTDVTFDIYSLAVCAYFNKGFVEESIDVMKSYVILDHQCQSIESQLDIYFNALSLISILSGSDQKVINFGTEVLAHIKNVVDYLGNLDFPIATPDKVKDWLEILTVSNSHIYSYDFAIISNIFDKYK
ncbi:hypothetical protein TVAG_271640 [Trichomonas vaginalis G3]|uniref:Uncharacterized protein n=1 Tax=Trichomonas vaginalis (strain ATCC PRA-98 / G3) TaxID=412133 RepID=A2E5R1_TRIV3|nr:hypothetical protein TVAGG3_0257360 [Trichomonas vaginalis G3]EAY11981.1 hypothetical protein TVAG_271640 [Trichomonas vaginalis G3]KAI5524854.1 hypothetical protein TVAGG3_0257360 [Trichomonas vaginalis G3]|eukprot:XP_001324204.1 hypothetical protein [Trichomonas vaginalis G3]